MGNYQREKSRKDKNPKYDLCYFCLYNAEHENLVGGGLRNSSNTVFTKLCTEILRSNRAMPLFTDLATKIALVFMLTVASVFYEVFMPFRILGCFFERKTSDSETKV